MKTRVTITMDPTLVAQAKSLAVARRTNLSAFFEELVRRASASEHPQPRFSQKWLGKVQAKSADPHDELLTALQAKHGLSGK